jgi:hypothetical protein
MSSVSKPRIEDIREEALYMMQWQSRSSVRLFSKWSAIERSETLGPIDNCNVSGDLLVRLEDYI